MSKETIRTLRFIFIICFVCAFLLSSLASLLKEPQQKAKELDRIQQMLLAAQIYNYEESFQIRDSQGLYIPARFDSATQTLVPASSFSKPSQADFFQVYNLRVEPLLVDAQGDTKTFTEAGINYTEYVTQHQKSGFSKLPLKLLYRISPNEPPAALAQHPTPEGYVIPINGFGLWDAIYGYLAIAADGDTVLGATWYQQAETAGLGAIISLPEWQKQFPGKKIFLQAANGTTAFDTTPLGLTVVKGKVSEVLGSSPKALSAIDGISGASLTGKGVTDAYADCLSPYRPFLIRVHKNNVPKVPGG